MFSRRLARSHTSEAGSLCSQPLDRATPDYGATSRFSSPYLQHWTAPTWDFSRVDDTSPSVPYSGRAFNDTSTARRCSANTALQSRTRSNHDLQQLSAPDVLSSRCDEANTKRHTIPRKAVKPTPGQQGCLTNSASPRISTSTSEVKQSFAIGSRILKEDRPTLVRPKPLRSKSLLREQRQGSLERREARRNEHNIASPQGRHASNGDSTRRRNPEKAPASDPSWLGESVLISHQTGAATDTTHDLASGTDTVTCLSCTVDLPAEDFSTCPLTPSCDHPNSACKDCVKQWIATRLGDGSWNEIKCLECTETMQYSDVQQHADPDVFRRYDAMAARSWVNNEENFVWCRNEGCGSGQVHDGGKDLPLFQCVACNARYCIAHEEPWHEGETCAAFDQRMNGEGSVEGRKSVDPTAARQVVQERPRTPTTFEEANDLQDRRLYDEARQHKTRTSDDQLALDFDAALALQHADDETSDYEHRNPKNRPPQSPAERFYFGPRFVQASTSRTRSVQDLFKRRTRGRYSLDEDPPPYTRPDAAQFVQDEELARSLEERSGKDASYARSLQEEYEQYERDRRITAGRKARRQRAAWQCIDDESYARGLQKQFEQEDRHRRAAVEQEAEHYRSIVEADNRTANDAIAARALQDQFEREEKNRVQQRKRDDRAREEREAYQRRKAEEKEGERTVRLNAKQCPSCRWYIQKNNGCDHMTCRKCKHEFCWLCLAGYSSGHRC